MEGDGVGAEVRLACAAVAQVVDGEGGVQGSRSRPRLGPRRGEGPGTVEAQADRGVEGRAEEEGGGGLHRVVGARGVPQPQSPFAVPVVVQGQPGEPNSRDLPPQFWAAPVGGIQSQTLPRPGSAQPAGPPPAAHRPCVHMSPPCMPGHHTPNLRPVRSHDAPLTARFKAQLRSLGGMARGLA